MQIAGDRIRDARVSLGIEPEELAANLGLSLEEYRDIEDFDDELEQGVAISLIRKICKLLRLDMCEIISFYIDDNDYLESISISELNNKIRAGVSIAEMSDFVGLYESECKNCLGDLGTICNWHCSRSWVSANISRFTPAI